MKMLSVTEIQENIQISTYVHTGSSDLINYISVMVSLNGVIC